MSFVTCTGSSVLSSLASPRRRGVFIPLSLAVGMQELDSEGGSGHQGPQILCEVIP